MIIHIRERRQLSIILFRINKTANLNHYKNKNSEKLFARALKSIPGGVNSPVRAFKSVGGLPVFIKKAKGSYLYDEDGNKYIDLIASWGPMILGHAYKPVMNAVKNKLKNSSSFGAPTEMEVEMAELIKKMCPGIEMIRMVSSGTEACMSALRLARGYTGKNKFIKFDGNYHGHADAFLVNAGSGMATLNIQSVPGVPAAISADTLTAPYNNIEAVKKLVAENKNEIAAIILEPVAGNMGCIPPADGYLKALREVCDKENILLIFDEVMTGFRLAPGGAQELYGVKADLVTYGKIIGGGLPVGAFGGSKKIMEHLAPAGKVYQAGTLSGNPIAMTAGFETLKTLQQNPEIYSSLQKKTTYLHEGLLKAFSGSGIPVAINQVGSMISVHFSTNRITDFASSAASDISLFGKYFHNLLSEGIYLPPSAYESWFLNDAITYKNLDKIIKASRKFAKKHNKLS